MANLRSCDLDDRPVVELIHMQSCLKLLQLELVGVAKHVIFETVAGGLSIGKRKHYVGVMFVTDGLLDAPRSNRTHEVDCQALLYLEAVFEDRQESFLVARTATSENDLRTCTFLDVGQFHVSDHSRTGERGKDLYLFVFWVELLLA